MQPLVSVLMPVYNEERYIRSSLAAVLEQDYPNLEVLVIDGGSTDRTVEITRAIQAADSRVRLLDNPGKKQVKALNIGLKAVRGEIIVRVDGHTYLAPDYVGRAVGYLLKDGADRVDNVGGLQRATGDTPIGEAIAAAYGSWFACPSPYRIAKVNKDVDTVFLGAWRREVFDRVGPWNETVHICEDCEHNHRIREAGGRVHLATDLKSSYVCRGSLAAVWRQYHAYGTHKMSMIHIHPAGLQWRQLVPPAFVAGLGGGAALGFAFPPAWWALGILLGIYIAISIAEALRVGGSKWSTIWRIPLVIATMHVSYGVGFLTELFQGATKATVRKPVPARIPARS